MFFISFISYKTRFYFKLDFLSNCLCEDAGARLNSPQVCLYEYYVLQFSDLKI